MPIAKHMRALYPANWKEISRRIRFERAGGKCEVCGVADGARGYRDAAGKFFEDGSIGEMDSPYLVNPRPKTQDPRPIKIVLTVAHLDHNPANNNDGNLKALCQRCHNKHDGAHRARNAARTRRSKRAAPIPFPYAVRCNHCTLDLGKISGPGFFGQRILCGACFISSLDGQKPLLPATTEAAK